MENNNTGEVYLHINNGGITFKLDKYDFSKNFNDKPRTHPKLKISAKHFYTTTNCMEIQVKPEWLRKMADTFNKWADIAEEPYKAGTEELKEDMSIRYGF